MTKNNDNLLAAEYALGLLNDTEMTALEKRLQNEPKLKAACVNWYEELASIYDGVEEVAPPAALKAKIQDRLFAAKQGKPERAKKSFWFWPTNLVCSLLLATLIGFIYQQSQQELFQADHTAVLATEDKTLQALASYDKSLNTLIVSSNKADPAPGRSYELWLIAGNNPPTSLGVLSNINNKSIVLTENLSTVIIGSTLAISDESAGGSPSGSPTGKVLATATVAEVGQE